MSRFTNLIVSPIYRDRLAVALTRIYSDESYLNLIKRPHFLGEALVHLGRLDEAKKLAKSTRKILKSEFLSKLIIYTATNLTNRLYKLIEIIKKHSGEEELTDDLVLSTIYTGSERLIKILYDHVKSSELKNTGFSKKEEKIANEIYLAYVLNQINLLRLEYPSKGVVNLVKEILSKKISRPSKMAYLSILISYLSRYEPVKMNQPYMRLLETLKMKIEPLEALSIPIIFSNLMVAGKYKTANRVLTRFIDVLLGDLEFDFNEILTILSQNSEMSGLKRISRTDDITNKFIWLTIKKYRVSEALLQFARSLKDLLKLRFSINLNKIEELAAAGLILTSNIAFLEVLLQTWIRQGYIDLAEEEIKRKLNEIKEREILEDFFYSLGAIYANKFSKEIRNTLEDILLKKKWKKSYIEGFIDGLYYESLTTHPIFLK